MMEPTPPRRPGELVFSVFLGLASLFLLYSAYGISGFEALSSPGAVPMATTAIMVLAMAKVIWDTLRKPASTSETLNDDILPISVIFIIAMIVAYAFLLQPLGFLPVSVLFLLVLIRFLSRRNWLFCTVVSVVTVAAIWLIFRMIFSVLMPQGIVPESRFVSFINSLF